MAIGERGLHRVVAHRLQAVQHHLTFASLQYLLARPVALHLGRGGIDAHELKRNFELVTV